MWPFSIFRRSLRSVLSSDFVEAVEHLHLVSERVARRWHHEYVGTEHCFLALIDAAPNAATALLERGGVAPDSVRQALEKVIIHGPDLGWHSKLPRTPRLQKALDFAWAEGKRQPSLPPAIAVLIGLACEGQGVAACVLSRLGLSADALRVLAAEARGGNGEGIAEAT
jgi:ATP-dependent Clp protease ATP-binding subunit ClpC